MEKALTTSWGRLTEMEPMEGGPRMEPSRWRAKAELKGQATEAKAGIRKTAAEPE